MIFLENEVLVIAKNGKDALSVMRSLQREYIIGAFDEEYSEVDNKENALKLVEKNMMYADAIYANGSFEDNESIVDRIFANLNSYMADDDFLFTYSYECA